MADIELARTGEVQAVQNDVDSLSTTVDSHNNNTSNPHSVSLGQLSDAQDLLLDLAANIPAASVTDRLAIETDSKRIVRDTGSAWEEIAKAPSEIGSGDLGFDPLTQSEHNSHAGDSSAHHTRYSDSEAVSAVNSEATLSVDISGDAETLDGFHAADLGSDVSSGGTTVVSNATDINFTDNLTVVDDTDGTVTVSHDFNRYTDSEAVSAVNAETSLSVDISGGASATQSNLDSHTSDTANPHSVTTSQINAVPTSEKASSGGVATLDSGGRVPNSQIPALAVTETFTVASDTEQTGLDAQEGDIAIRTDENRTYILSTNDPSTLSNWKEVKTPTDSVDSVFGRTGAITAESGDYDVSQITSAASTSYVDSHTTDTTNPHSVTASQVSALPDSGGSLSGNLGMGTNAVDLNDGRGVIHEIVSGSTYDTSDGIMVRTESNPTSGNSIFRVLSSGGSERLRVEHSGKTDTTNTLHEQGDRVATRTWSNSNFNNYTFSESHTDLTNVSSDDHHTRYADTEAVSAVNSETSLSVDISGDAETVDGFHAGDLGSDVSDGGTLVVSKATDINFANNLSVTDDTDGTVTVDANRYTDSEAISAVNAETSLSVNVTGTADSTQSDVDSHKSNTSNPHSVTASQVGAPTTSDLDSHTSSTSNPHAVTLEQARSQNNSISGDIAFNNSFTTGAYDASTLIVRNSDGSNGWFFEGDGNFDSSSITSNDVTSNKVTAGDQMEMPTFATRSDIPSGQEGVYYVEDEDKVIYRTEDTVDSSYPTDGYTVSVANRVESQTGTVLFGGEHEKFSDVSSAESASLDTGTIVVVDGELYWEDGT